MSLSNRLTKTGLTTPSNPDSKTVVQGITTFALDLFSKLREKDNNVCFSPYSISSALAMTYVGARGKTAKQMAETLHFTLAQDRLLQVFASMKKDLDLIGKKGVFQLFETNSLWPQREYSFLAEYLSVLEKYFKTGVKSVDYQDTENARNIINDWVRKRTQNKIKELVSAEQLNKSTRFLLVNAIYFKADWAKEFKESSTKDDQFWVTREEFVSARMMYQYGQFRYAETPELQILEMPYKGEFLSMLVLLPKRKDGLAELQESLSPQLLEEWVKNLSHKSVNVHFPKFRMVSQFDLADALASIGMPDAFSDDDADFSGIVGQKDLCLNAILHKTVVQVDERGTEAITTAATTVKLRRIAGGPPPPIVFRANRPFIFLIRDNYTENNLFVGRVLNPNPTAKRTKGIVVVTQSDNFDMPFKHLKNNICLQLKDKKINEKILGVVGEAYQEALENENVILSHNERNRIFWLVVKETLNDILTGYSGTD